MSCEEDKLEMYISHSMSLDYKILNCLYSSMESVVHGMVNSCHEHEDSLKKIEPLRLKLKEVLSGYKDYDDSMFSFGTKEFNISEDIQRCEHWIKYFGDEIKQSMDAIFKSLGYKYLVDGFNGYNEYLHGTKPLSVWIDKVDLLSAAISDLDIGDFEEWCNVDGFQDNLSEDELTHVRYQEIRGALTEVRNYLQEAGFDIPLWASPLESDAIHFARERISSLTDFVPERVKGKSFSVDDDELPF